MNKIDPKIFVIIALVFAFELICPQFSYAAGSPSFTNTKESAIFITDLKQPIIFDPIEAPSHLPQSQFRKPVRKLMVSATAYSSTVDQCDGDPFTTANGRQVSDGIIAANGLPFGTRIKIPKMFGDKVFSVEDRMNAKYDGDHIDVWFPTREQAIKFGVRFVEIEIY